MAPFSGDWDVVFDGIAVVNMGSEATDVRVRQKRLRGGTINEVTAITNLAPRAKGLYVIGSPSGSEFSDTQDTYCEIEGSQDLALVALRGTPPGSHVGYLWENAIQTSPLTSYETMSPFTKYSQLWNVQHAL